MHRQSHGNDNATLVTIAGVLGSDAIRMAINAHGQGCDVTVFVNEPKKNKDVSIDIYFATEPPKGWEKNWIQTIPGKSWFIILPLCGPLQPWLDQTWRPGEMELVKGN